MTAWIAVDWGTTHLRAWRMDGSEAVDRAASNDGMGGLSPNAFEPALLRLVEPWLEERTRVVACGMVGSRQGWVEAPYRAVPCEARTVETVTAPATDARLDVRIVPGVKQEKPVDVMRGEETQIAGLLAREPGFDGVVCLPGTHSKWAQISAGEIVSFRTFMTGEMFELLATQSVLRHSVPQEGWDDAAFADTVADTLSRPERLTGDLFGLRAGALLQGTDGATLRARLSGLLIGAELAAARPYWLGQRVISIGAPALTAHYSAALTAQGLSAETADGGEMTRAGLAAVHDALEMAG